MTFDEYGESMPRRFRRPDVIHDPATEKEEAEILKATKSLPSQREIIKACYKSSFVQGCIYGHEMGTGKTLWNCSCPIAPCSKECVVCCGVPSHLRRNGPEVKDSL
jgi:hypothetical protein